VSGDDLAKGLEQKLEANTRQVFEIIPSYFDKEEAKAIAALIAQVAVATGPCWLESRQVREMLERHAALDTSAHHR
jgi:shikimate kinase